ncbi:MAG: hypothetical protein ACTSPY_16405 [Candidatus Helarchaeota archaeon]
MTDDKKIKNRKKIITILTFMVVFIFLGIFFGLIYSLIEMIPIPAGFETKWIWYLSNPFYVQGSCPWGLKILIFGALMGYVFIGLTISIYIWKKGKNQFYKWIYGEEIEYF